LETVQKEEIMAIRVQPTHQIQITMNTGIATDYTYVSSATDLATVDTNGLITGVAPGMVAISITRKSDSKLVQNYLLEVESSTTDYSVNRPYVIPTVLP
jgi:uncharacterized protein YjdB